jgi:hypothetical protein
LTTALERKRWALLCVLVSSVSPSAARADMKACLDAAEDGQKLRDSGAYRAARGRFIACAANECPGEVRKGCVGWLGELDKLIPTVVFGARVHGKEVSDVRVSVDGEPVAERIDGKPVALDPGEHHFRFERAGETDIDETAVVMAGEKERLMTVDFGSETPLLPLPSPPTPQQSPSPSPSPPTPTPSATTRERETAPKTHPQDTRTAAYALGALGLVSLAAGAALDVSGYVFLQQCNGDASCRGGHERAEVEWRFVTGDVLLGAGVLSSVAAWLLWPRGTSVAHHPMVVIGVDRFIRGARVGLTAVF